MLKAYVPDSGALKGIDIAAGEAVPVQSVWIDLLKPTEEERRKVDALIAMETPTRADMEEIEISSRLYQENGGIFLTALVTAGTDTESPVADVVSFVLAH